MIHQELLNKSQWYKRWHEYENHSVYHWALFIIFSLVITNLTLSKLGDGDYSLTIKKAYALSEPLLHKGDLTYVGSFRLPVGSGRGFDYSDAGVAYNPANNSLFKTGSTFEKKIAEISIPTPVNYNVSSNLPRASILQNLVDATEGNFDHIDAKGLPCCVNGDNFGGLLVHNGKLIGTVYAYYDGGHEATLSHFKSGLNLSASGDFGGMYQISSPEAGFVAGYMASVPSEWQASLGGTALTGQCCLPIIGRTSSGPSAFVFDPDDLGVKNPVPSSALIYYPLGHDNLGTYANSSVANPLFNKGTVMGGMVFPAGTQSVLYFGRTGLGIPCYGTGDSDISLHLQPVPGQPGNQYCYDPDDHNKGSHAYPYSAYVWAYDVQDLIAVKNGSKNPWDVRPYDSWTFNYPTSVGSVYNLGVAYDQSAQKIYVVQNHGDPNVYDPPIVHVYQLNVSGVPNPTPPSTPSPTASFSSSPSSINSGSSSNLSWSTTNASSVSINQGVGSVALSGTKSVSPAVTTTYTITVSGAGGSVTGQATVTVNPVAPSDSTPPTAPTGLTATAVSSSQINLSWNPSTDNVGVSGYSILKNGVFITTSKTTSYSDTGLSPNTKYSYTVVAYDAATNSSGQSNTASATTNQGADVTPPTISSVTSSSITSSDVVIGWTTSENSDSQVEYGLTTSYGSFSGLNQNSTISHSVSLTSLSFGTLYHYRVKSRDSSGNLSTGGDNTFTTAPAVSVPVVTPVNPVQAPVTFSQGQLTMTLVGNNPAYVPRGSSFIDPGIIITGSSDFIFKVMTKVNGKNVGPLDNYRLDTSVSGTYVMDYSVTDSAGLSISGSRTVIVNPTGTPPSQQNPIVSVAQNTPANTVSNNGTPTVKVNNPSVASVPTKPNTNTQANVSVKNKVVATLDINPPIVCSGKSAILTWYSNNADSVSIDQDIKTPSLTGEEQISPQQTTTYTLTAKNKKGGNITTSATVSVRSCNSVYDLIEKIIKDSLDILVEKVNALF